MKRRALLKLSRGLPLLLLAGPSILFSQQMGKEEARGKLNSIEFEIKKYSRTGDFNHYKQIEGALSEVIRRCNDREMLYTATYLNANLVFTRDKRTITPAFSLLEKCIIEYPEQEAIAGLAAEALDKISDRFSSKMKLIGTSICYELHNLSPNSDKNSSGVKRNLNAVLNKNIGGTFAAEAVHTVFTPDGLNCYADNLPALRTNHITIKNVSGHPYFATELNEPIIISSSSRKPPFPEMTIKSPERVFSTKNNPIDMTSYVRENFRNQSDEELSRDIRSKGVRTVSSSMIYRFRKDPSIAVWGVATELIVKPGITTKNLLEAGGVNPCGWVYSSGAKW